MPRPDADWDPYTESDADHHWRMMESESYQDVVTGLTCEPQEDVLALDWEEATAYAERELHTGKIHRS